jgi:hypothetical protein
MPRILALVAALAAAPTFAQTPVDQLARPPANARVWTITTNGGAARFGQVSLWTDASGTRWSRFSLNLRGFVSEIEEQNRFAADGTLESMIIRGRTPQGDAAERYTVKDGVYSFASPVDHGSGPARPNLEYVAFGGTFDSLLFIVDAMLKSPTHSVDLLPSGQGKIEPLTTLEVSNGTEEKTLTAYAITGFGLSPSPVWMDGGTFFGMVPDFLPEGWEKAGAAMSKAQDEALAKRAPALVARIAKTPAGPVVFSNVKLYAADARVFRDAQTVVVENGRIADVGPAVEVKAPANAQIIDGTVAWQDCRQFATDCRTSARAYNPVDAPALGASTISIGDWIDIVSVTGSAQGFLVVFEAIACDPSSPDCQNSTTEGLYGWRFKFPHR